MKAPGKDIKEFWTNHWPEGMYIDDTDESLFDEKGDPNLEDTRKYDLSRFGYMMVDDKTKAKGNKDGPFSSYFARWHKAQITACIVVAIPRAEFDSAIEILARYLPSATIYK